MFHDFISPKLPNSLYRFFSCQIFFDIRHAIFEFAKTVAHDGQEARICLDIKNWLMQKLGFPVLNKFEWFNVEFLNMG